MQYNDQGIRHTAFGAERRMPCGRTVQIFAPELDRQEQARLLGRIEIAELEKEEPPHAG